MKRYSIRRARAEVWPRTPRGFLRTVTGGTSITRLTDHLATRVTLSPADFALGIVSVKESSGV